MEAVFVRSESCSSAVFVLFTLCFALFLFYSFFSGPVVPCFFATADAQVPYLLSARLLFK